MQVNVAQLLKGATGETRSVEFCGPILDLGDQAPAHVDGVFRLTKTDRGIWVSGPAQLSVEGSCSRCLVDFTYWVQVQVDDEFLPTIDIATGAKLHYENEVDAEVHGIDAQHVLDISDVLRQYRSAAMPLAPVCRDDCKGICPTCGADLNESPCHCEPALDPRWEKLRELLR